ncbi:MAG: autotransporter outer membrane beta-barrel domain-containing protein, partial [Deltaproteobacteria bacterium]|nr:autotransporter outer membrane beta-barrel domain-containing protein [Deltaproteobacteria bacterium]
MKGWKHLTGTTAPAMLAIVAASALAFSGLTAQNAWAVDLTINGASGQRGEDGVGGGAGAGDTTTCSDTAGGTACPGGVSGQASAAGENAGITSPGPAATGGVSFGASAGSFWSSYGNITVKAGIGGSGGTGDGTNVGGAGSFGASWAPAGWSDAVASWTDVAALTDTDAGFDTSLKAISVSGLDLQGAYGGHGGKDDGAEGGEAAAGGAVLLNFDEVDLTLNGALKLAAGHGNRSGLNDNGGAGGDGGAAGLAGASVAVTGDIALSTGMDGETIAAHKGGDGAGAGGFAKVEAGGSDATAGGDSRAGVISSGGNIEITVNDGDAYAAARGGDAFDGAAYAPKEGRISAASGIIIVLTSPDAASYHRAEPGVTADPNDSETWSWKNHGTGDIEFSATGGDIVDGTASATATAGKGSITAGEGGIAVDIRDGHGFSGPGASFIAATGGAFIQTTAASTYSGAAGDGVISSAGKLQVTSADAAAGIEKTFSVTSAGGAVTVAGTDAGAAGGAGLIDVNGIALASTGLGGGAIVVRADGSAAGAAGAATGAYAGGSGRILSGTGAVEIKVDGGSASAIDVQARGGDGVNGGSGGDAALSGSTISLSTAGSGTGGDILYHALAGSGSAAGKGAGGQASLTATEGALTLTAETGAVDVQVYGGQASPGANWVTTDTTAWNGGSAAVSAKGVTVQTALTGPNTAAAGTASLDVQGAAGLQGGTARLESGGDVTVKAASGTGAGGAGIAISGGSSDAPAAYAGQRNGGEAVLDATGHKIVVAGLTGTGAGASIAVAGGSAAGANTVSNQSLGGKGSLLAGDVEITASKTPAGISVSGGPGAAGAGWSNAGEGYASIGNLAVVSDDLAPAIFSVSGGLTAGGNGLGAGATFRAADVTVTSKAAGDSAIAVAASDNAGASADAAEGADVSFTANDVRVSAETDGDAGIFLQGGSVTNPSAAGAVPAGGTVSAGINSLTVQGSPLAAADGSAYFGAQGGNWDRTDGYRGLADLKVKDSIKVTGGAGTSLSQGGQAQVAFDDIDAKDISVESTAASATGAAGRASLLAWNSLAAGTIDVTRPSGATAAQAVVWSPVLNVTDRDTRITLHNTEYGNFGGSDPRDVIGVPTGDTTATGVSFDRVNIANGRNLLVGTGGGVVGGTDYGAGGQIAIGAVNVPDGGKAGLGVSYAPNASIGSLTAKGGEFTIHVPEVFLDTQPVNGTVLAVTGTADLTGTTVIVEDVENLVGAVTPRLIQAGTLLAPSSIVYDPLSSDGTLDYIFDFTPDGTGGILATYYGARVSGYVKGLAEGSAAATAFVNSGSDLAAGDGIASAVFAAADAGPSFFSAISYGSSRYKTGSHVDVKGLSLLLGGAYGFDVSAGRFTLGAFFEYGDGSYDSYDENAGWRGGRGFQGETRGSGDLRYVGGGILTRYDFSDSYVEFTARAGRSSVEYSAEGWAWQAGGAGWPAAGRDYDATYYGLHLGYGHVFRLTDAVSLDLGLKWLFTHQDGGDFLTPRGGRISLDDVNSHRLRFGGRVSVAATDAVRPYFGLYYEHELDGTADARAAGLSLLDAPELKGGTGIGELGLAITATEGLTVDVGVKGYVGTRRG